MNQDTAASLFDILNNFKDLHTKLQDQNLAVDSDDYRQSLFELYENEIKKYDDSIIPIAFAHTCYSLAETNYFDHSISKMLSSQFGTLKVEFEEIAYLYELNDVERTPGLDWTRDDVDLLKAIDLSELKRSS